MAGHPKGIVRNARVKILPLQVEDCCTTNRCEVREVVLVLSGTAVLENALSLGAGAFLGALQWFHERRHSDGEV